MEKNKNKKLHSDLKKSQEKMEKMREQLSKTERELNNTSKLVRELQKDANTGEEGYSDLRQKIYSSI